MHVIHLHQKEHEQDAVAVATNQARSCLAK
jgi:hypothetical protein